MSPSTLAIFVVILLLNAFFCAAETALTAVSESKLRPIADRGSRRATILIGLLHRRSNIVAGLLVGQNIVGAILAVYSTMVINGIIGNDLPAWAAAATAALLSIGLLLVFGEVIPKSLAVSFSTSWSLAFAYPVLLISWLFKPITAVLGAMSNGVLRLLGRAGTAGEPQLTVEEIQAIARMGFAAGAIDEFEGEIVSKAAMLNDIRIREIMIPRTDVSGIEVSMPLSEIRAFLQRSPHSRIPVYKGDLDDIVGILHFKDFLRHAPEKNEDFELVSFLHKPLFVPESMFIGNLLQQMQARRTHLAIVLDEYGGTSGLITLEDIVEMLVGRIEDEYDAIAVPFEKVDEQTWDVDGRVIDEVLFQNIGVQLPPEATEAFHTVAGLALTAFGNIPSAGDVTTYHNLEITALRVQGNRVRRVRVRVLPPPADSTRRPTVRIAAAGPDSLKATESPDA